MKYLYLLIILGLLAGGVYLYYQQDQENTRLLQRNDELTRTVDQLHVTIKDLETEKASLTKNLSDAQAKVADLTSQIAASKQAVDEATSEAEESKKVTATASAATEKAKKQMDDILHPPAPTNKLGTIVTVDGKTYENCHLQKVEASNIIINSSSGIVSIIYPFLPLNLQKKFGYTPLTPGQLSASQVTFQENIRLQAGD